MSRYDDPTMVECEDCLWQGRVSDCIHEYKKVGIDEVEPVDLCPECGSSNLRELSGGTAQLHLVPV